MDVEKATLRTLSGSYLFSLESLNFMAASIFVGRTYLKSEITSWPLGEVQNLFLSLRLTSALRLLYKWCVFDK